MNKEQYIIELLKDELEFKYHNGDRVTWTHHDYQNLSNFIHKKSGISISISTLKRLYGKIASDSTPRHSSLDAICIYLGYKSWYDYQQKKESTIPINKNKSKKSKKKRFSILSYFIIALVLLIGSYFSIDFFLQPGKT